MLCEKDWEDEDGTRNDPNKDDGKFFKEEKPAFELEQCYGIGDPDNAFNVLEKPIIKAKECYDASKSAKSQEAYFCPFNL